MEKFPSDLELTVASALLLLSDNEFHLTTTTATPTSANSLCNLEEESVEAVESKLWKKSSSCNLDKASVEAVERKLWKNSSLCNLDKESVEAVESKLWKNSSLCNLVEVSVEAFESKSWKKSDEVEISSFENSFDTTPCPSSLTIDDEEDSVHSHRYKLMASAVSRYRELKLKVARRARSKVIYRGFSDKKPAQKMWTNPPPIHPSKASTSQAVTEGITTTERSCLSSGETSEISSARNEGKAVVVEQRRRRGIGSAYISRRAEAILRVLSCGGCASEVRIRQLLGDSPDTSKALRMLLKMEEVKRYGAGGRADPFIYMIAADSSSIVN